MSNDKKKALLNESTTKRFWKLAGLRPIHEKAYVFEEEEELEEMRAKKEDDKDEVDEGMRPSKHDEKDDVDEGMRPSKHDEEEVDEMKKPGGSGIKGVYNDTTEDPNKYKAQKVGTKGSTVQDVKPRKMNEDDLGEMGMPPADEDDMDMGAEEPEMEMDPEGPEDGQDVEVDVPEGDVASLRTARDILDQILSAVDGGGEEPEMDVEEPEMDDEDPEALEEGDDEELNEIDQEELEEVAERIASRVAKRIAESLKRK